MTTDLNRLAETADAEGRGFQFPGTFEITAFGENLPELEAIVLSELTAAGVAPDMGSVRQRLSRGDRYLAVSVSFACDTRELYQEAYRRLRAHPAIRMTL
jgi:putative lipoic acid-binding regulatory protein